MYLNKSSQKDNLTSEILGSRIQQQQQVGEKYLVVLTFFVGIEAKLFETTGSQII